MAGTGPTRNEEAKGFKQSQEAKAQNKAFIVKPHHRSLPHCPQSSWRVVLTLVQTPHSSWPSFCLVPDSDDGGVLVPSTVSAFQT